MTSTDMPEVDIIIAARNEAARIGACLDAMSAQDYPSGKLRCWVVDNGSTDATAAIAQARGGRVLSHPTPGAAGARNVAIRQSTAPFVGLLDAHCIAVPTWVSAMVEQLHDPRIGGCQGATSSRSASPRVQRYLDGTGALSNTQILSDSVDGAHNLYPWLLGGNSMYRRAALDAAGLFDADLHTCEDVDLAWRVVLLGYRLGYAPAASIVHYDDRDWHGFISKAFAYARGAATLAYIYSQHGARRTFSPTLRHARSLEMLSASMHYWAGFRLQDLRLRCGLDAVRDQLPVRAVREEFRPWFKWSDAVQLRISPEAIFWFTNNAPSSVIVHVPSKLRVVLDATADFIWRRLSCEVSRAEMIAALMQEYGIAAVTAGADLDDLVEELNAARLIVRAPV